MWSQVSLNQDLAHACHPHPAMPVELRKTGHPPMSAKALARWIEGEDILLNVLLSNLVAILTFPCPPESLHNAGMRPMTYYDVLQVPSHASADAIRVAYRAMAKRYHPDANPLNRNVAAAQFRVIQDAYDHLRDPDRRRAYDQTLRARVWTIPSAVNDTSSADDFFTSARRTLERLMRLMATTRDVTVKGDHHG